MSNGELNYQLPGFEALSEFGENKAGKERAEKADLTSLGECWATAQESMLYTVLGDDVPVFQSEAYIRSRSAPPED